MKESNIFKLMDLMEDLKKVNSMIKLHSENPSDFMLIQYKAKRDKLMSYLIDELVKPDVRSAKSFAIISKLLNTQYPNLKKEAKKADESHKLLDRLELALV
jgi:hypothetical protein